MNLELHNILKTNQWSTVLCNNPPSTLKRLTLDLDLGNYSYTFGHNLTVFFNKLNISLESGSIKKKKNLQILGLLRNPFQILSAPFVRFPQK